MDKKKLVLVVVAVVVGLLAWAAITGRLPGGNTGVTSPFSDSTAQ